jgi:hypothetical protein
MGLFSNAKSLSPIFQLPKVFGRECVQLFTPKKSSFPVANLRWVDNQFKSGQGPEFWVIKIFDSEKYWLQQGRDIQIEAAGLVAAACRADSFQHDKETWSTLFLSAKFGLLAGLFEVASGATKVNDCHPLTWNALTFFNQSIADEQKEPFEDEHKMLLICMPYGGYVYGKLKNVSAHDIYAQWL